MTAMEAILSYPAENDLPCICICRLPGFNNDSLILSLNSCVRYTGTSHESSGPQPLQPYSYVREGSDICGSSPHHCQQLTRDILLVLIAVRPS